jgi:hypothetical protein
MANRELERSIASLIAYDEESLIKQVAMRAEAAKDDPSIAGSYEPKVTYDFEHAGIAGDLLDLGGRILRRWERELHGVVCGTSQEDAEDRANILSKIGADDAVLGAAVATVLIGLGVSAAVAAVLAALLLKRILKPGGHEVCKFWSERLTTS